MGVHGLPGEDTGRCRFYLSPPRNFLYPAILLLLSEQPRHGYRLVDPLLEMGFGSVERASVYRTLGDLVADGLLEYCDARPSAGTTRHIYNLTPSGHGVLEEWMAAVDEQRCRLERVCARYEKIGHR
ncbi:MAG: helix-turn-helix transcriptional regulator [Acidimicrobiales bacterium]